MLEIKEPKLSPEAEELLRAVAEAIQKLGSPRESGEAGEQARLYADHLIIRRSMLKDPAARAFEKRFELVGKNSTVNEIAHVGQMAKNLLTAILASHAPARHLMGLIYTLRARPGSALEENLKDLIENCERSEVPELPKNVGRGRKKTGDVAKFTFDLARLFQLYTGNKPTVRTKDSKAYGPFFEFVADIFRILEIPGSPESRARAVVQDMAKYARESLD